MNKLSNMNLEERIELEKLKIALKFTTYLFVDKSKASEPILLLYSRGGGRSTCVLRSASVNSFISRAKTITQIRKHDLDVHEVEARRRCEEVDASKPKPAKEGSFIAKGEHKPKPHRNVEPGDYWWNKD